MSDSLNAQTKANLSKNIQHLHEKCVDVFNIITNAPLDDGISPESIGEKALCYVEGLRTNIQNANTDVINDENLILNEFLAESKERQVQIKELTAFTRGAIFEIEYEIKRLKNITQISEEALSRPRVVQHEILSEHIHKARSTFQTLKSELLGVVQSIFPNDSEAILNIIRQLNQEKSNHESNGYIPITHESFWIFEFLQDMKIVSLNPYNNMEAKLAY
ncbi:uncharacterized protein LOC121726097 [Aricia agestis]|uniref:uncharacterized protein LOC121726097 n=1 Tax=Aricia agestis TaxID=91739 RepID=UPI001C205227|nr:uncharacterized protein LOC121726097 [Aricia agestis]